MRMPSPSDSPQVSHRDAALQARPVASEITPLSGGASGSEATLHGEAAGIIEEARGGEPLPEAVRSYMEPRFGADFSHVRVHSGAESARLNDSLHAQAFTYGRDIWLGQGESSRNLSLMAHELTHVVQQSPATAIRPPPARQAVQRKTSTWFAPLADERGGAGNKSHDI